jgi:hypothetical protein
MLSKKQLEDATNCIEGRCEKCTCYKGNWECYATNYEVAADALALYEILEKLEWILAHDNYGEDINLCPDCGKERHEGHAKSCELEKLLGR